jgi:hypothetical protein
MTRLKGFEQEGEPFDVANAYKGLTSDIITTYGFGESHGFLDRVDFEQGFWRLFKDLQQQVSTCYYGVQHTFLSQVSR